MKINGQFYEVPSLWEGASLLSYLRDCLGLTGTKFGCGQGICGACTVHVNGEAARACLLLVENLADQEITTIEGLGSTDALHPVQQAWKDTSVPQCGYCQPGQMMTAAAYLARNPAQSESDAADAMSANICRCGTYVRVRKAVLRAAELVRLAP